MVVKQIATMRSVSEPLMSDLEDVCFDCSPLGAPTFLGDPAQSSPDTVRRSSLMLGHTLCSLGAPTFGSSPSWEQALPEAAWRPAMGPFGRQRALHALHALQRLQRPELLCQDWPGLFPSQLELSKNLEQETRHPQKEESGAVSG